MKNKSGKNQHVIKTNVTAYCDGTVLNDLSLIKVQDMKFIGVTGIVIAVLIAVFYFTKPSDDRCRTEALKIVSGDMIKIPGYSDPNVANALTGPPEPDKILINDRFLWKDVSYVLPSTVKHVGKGYLGRFHPRD